MKWSWKVARVSGIDIYLHITFVIVIAWIALAYWQMTGTLSGVLNGVGFILALFFCVLLHEFGHAFTARRYGIRTRNIVLLPIGGLASIEKMPDDPRQEMVIAMAGPVVSFGIAVLLWLALAAAGAATPLAQLSLSGGSFLERLMLVNFLLGAFNLLPAFPMDGGRVFRAALATRLGPLQATRIAARVAQFAAFVMALIGLQYDLWLVLIAVFIWIGAATEEGMAGVKSALAGLTARNAMLTHFDVLGPDDSLGHAVQLTLAGTQKDFPVVDNGKVVGVLRQSDLLRGLHDHGKLARVDQVMHRDVPLMQIDEPLDHVLENLQTRDSPVLAVMEHGHLAGVIDIDNVMEMLRIEQALREHELAGG